MKKLLSICVSLTIFTFSCGFVKTDTILNIDKNDKVSIEMTNLMNDGFGEEILNTFTSSDNYGRDGLKVDVKKENGYTGVHGKKEYELKNISTDKSDKIERSSYLTKEFNDKNLIQVEKGFFKNKYKIEFTFEKTKTEDLLNAYKSVNPFEITDNLEYTNCMSAVTNSGSEDTNNCIQLVPDYEQKLKEYEDNIKKLENEMEYNFTIMLPVSATESNETLKSNDGKKLTWTLTNEGVNDINCSFEILNMTNIYLLGGGSLLLAIIIIILLIMINKKKKEKIETVIEEKPIHTDYDPSIAAEIDAMGGFIDRGKGTEIPEVEMVETKEQVVAPTSYEYTLPHEVPNVIEEKDIPKDPLFITSQNTKEDEIIIKEEPKKVEILKPEGTEMNE